MSAIWWIRRDLRVADNAALAAAAAETASGDVTAVFVLDPVFLSVAGAPRLSFLFDNLRALDEACGGTLAVVHGDPVVEIPALAGKMTATVVHVAGDFGPYGRRRDAAVADALQAVGSRLVVSDTPYAVAPGMVRKDDGDPLRVFTPFYKRWQGHDWTNAASVSPSWRPVTGVRTAPIPTNPGCDAGLPPAGEAAAWDRWRSWSATGLADYKEVRNNPGVDGTSMLSPYLRFGILHPRQLLADLPGGPGSDHFRSEICWREFYADVLWHRPETAWENLQPKMNALPVDTDAAAKKRFATWCEARTGFPIVDAGIRQMLATGWMHNRVRMIVASFLVKDLHLPWQWGARFFMRHLVDGDLASNNHGWQWTAGTGTDAAPYFRVFNPMGQSAKFDPSGDYLRRWVPELADLDDAHIHEPWTAGLMTPADYPAPMVDHAVEREEALARYKAVSGK
jgi:deoxyribodipyrimidine photo-lyase